MPALNFQARFAPLVESGQKRQTIRAYRKDGRDPKPGQLQRRVERRAPTYRTPQPERRESVLVMKERPSASLLKSSISRTW